MCMEFLNCSLEPKEIMLTLAKEFHKLNMLLYDKGNVSEETPCPVREKSSLVTQQTDSYPKYTKDSRKLNNPISK